MPDLTTLTDDDLDTLQANLDAERTRRLRLASIPQQITGLAADYEAAGGTKADLAAAIE